MVLLLLKKVLNLMRQVSDDDVEEEDDSSDVSGYHSDSDSAVMASGNSPFVSKSARCHFLTRSGNQGDLINYFFFPSFFFFQGGRYS